MENLNSNSKLLQDTNEEQMEIDSTSEGNMVTVENKRNTFDIYFLSILF